MANVYTRIANASADVSKVALELKTMLADGVIDAREINRLPALAEQMLDASVMIDDVACDIDYAKQVLTLGRERTPNAVLLARSNKLASLLWRISLRRKAKAPVLAEAQRTADGSR